MNIVHTLKDSLLALGATSIMWLLLGLSVLSVALILERVLFFTRSRCNIETLGRALEHRLAELDVDGAKQALLCSHSVESAIARRGLEAMGHGPIAVREAVAGAVLLKRAELERGLNYLGTLASNAPFIGLFGTVIGIILAFEELSAGANHGSVSEAVMASIAEALVATAVGIAVAVPAVVAYNAFQTSIQRVFERAHALEHVILLHLASAGRTEEA